jgi:D-inositol-3-phosphate glycosyltransferase
MYSLALLSVHGCPFARLGERDTGGMNVYLLQVARELGKRGHRADVYTRVHDPNDPEIVELGENARVIHVQAGPHGETKQSLHRHIPQFLEGLEAFREREGIAYDLVHSHYWLSCLAAIDLSRDWGVPHIATFHTLARAKQEARPGEQESQLRIESEREAMMSADSMVVSTERERSDIARLYGVPAGKVDVVPAGVDLQMFRPLGRAESRRRLGLSDERVILAVAQRIEPLKGLDVIVEALPLMDDGGEARFIIVGGDENSGPEIDRLRGVAARMGVEDRLTFAGAVSQEELPAYYSAADVCVLPSYYESFGLAALESLACGTPVVASRVGGPLSFIVDGVNGHLVPERSPEAYARCLDVVMLEGPEMAEAARSTATELGWDSVADGLLAHYASMIEERRMAGELAAVMAR